MIWWRTVSFSAAVTYALFALIAFIYVAKEPSLPQEGEHKDLIETAWKRLQNIALRPHPYGSQVHDRIWEYLFDTLRDIADSDPYHRMEIIQDSTSNAMTTSRTASRRSYLEGNNIIVVFPGVKDDKEATLISAHYDCAPLSMGATDNGVGVVTLLALAEYFAQNAPDYPVILNFNTGEELGLFGSRAFLKNNVSDSVTQFLNLDGAGTGGRPLLFRVTDKSVLYAFSGRSGVRGSSLDSDLFQTGLIRSSTDYSIYQDEGWSGLDYAFYKGRQNYHTPNDNIRYTSRNSVKGMLDTTLEMAKTLSTRGGGSVHNGPDEGFAGLVYFDILGVYVVAFALKYFVIYNISMLVAGPIILVLLLIARHKALCGIGRRGWFRLPFALVVSIGIACIIDYLIYRFNVAAVYHSNLPFFTIFFLTSSVMTLIIALFSSMRHNQHSTLIFSLQLYFVLWVLLAVLVGFEFHYKVGGPFQLTVLISCLFLFIILHVLSYRSPDMQEILRKAEEQQGSRAVGYTNPNLLPPRSTSNESHERVPSYSSVEHRNDSSSERSVPPVSEENDTHNPENTADGRRRSSEGHESNEPDESSPLLATVRKIRLETGGKPSPLISFVGFLEWLVLFPLPIYLMCELLFQTSEALGETLISGSSPLFLYSLPVIMSLLIIAPSIPLLQRFGYITSLIMFILGAIFLVATILFFPFNQDSPMKIFVNQQIDLDLSDSASIVEFVGLKDYLPTVLKELPNLGKLERAQDVVDGTINGFTCVPANEESKQWSNLMYRCRGPGPEPRLVENAGSFRQWVAVTVKDIDPDTSMIEILPGRSISGATSYSCSVVLPSGVADNGDVKLHVVGYDANEEDGSDYGSYEMDFNAKNRKTIVSNVVVYTRGNLGDDNSGQDPGPIKVELTHNGKVESIRVGCGWSEWIPGRFELPLADEFIEFAPSWSTISSKSKSGLGTVEVWQTVNLSNETSTES